MATTSFAATIETIALGEIDDLATNEMRQLVNEMLNLERTVGGKQKGTLTVKLSFSLEKGIFDTQAEVSVKRPAKGKPRAFLYATKEGGLSEEDQRQGKLDFGAAKDVSTGAAGNVRSIDDRRMAAANDKP